MSASSPPLRRWHERLSLWGASCVGLTLGAGVEGLHIALSEQALSPFAALLNIGFLAPLLLLAATVLALIASAWIKLGWLAQTPRANAARLTHWAWSSPAAVLARRTSGLVAAVVSLAGFFGGSFWIGSTVLAAVARPQMGLGLLLGAQLALGLVCAGLFGLMYRYVGALSVAVAARAPRVIVAPASWLALACIIALGAALFLSGHEVGEHLPWHLTTGFVAGFAGIWAGWSIARRFPVSVAVGSLAALVGCAAITVWLPHTLRGDRAIFTELSPVSAPVFSRLEPRLDFDGDGAIHLFGGRDCAPDDPAIHPGALELLNNGIDEDCSGADLTNPLQVDEAARSYGKPAAVKKQPHIFLITTDSLSMGRTSLVKGERDVTPNLARFAEDAVVFEHGFALGPSTRLGLPGLLAGVYNSSMPLRAKGGQPYGWEKSTPSIAQTLQDAGYQTIQVMGSRYFTSRWKDGPSHGFEVRDDEPARKARDRAHTAPEVTDRVLEFAGKAKTAKKPTFLWAHYYDHHSPFRRPKDGVDFGDTASDRFDSELHFADVHWGRLFDGLAELFEPDEYVVVFTSDHGEAFDEFHTKKHHGYDLRTPLLHVPMIVRTGVPPRRVEGLVTHADVAPTLADIAGAPRAPEWVGESLTPVIYDAKQPQKTVVYGLLYIPERVAKGTDPFVRLSVRTEDLYLETNYQTDVEHLSLWKTDPVGRENLVGKRPDDVSLLRHLTTLKRVELEKGERALRGSELDRGEKAKKNASGGPADGARGRSKSGKSKAQTSRKTE